jgi:hypothetical protein
MARRTAHFGVILGVGALATLGARSLAQTPTTDAAAVEAKALAVGAGDLNGDGVTNGVDLDILIDNLGIAADALATQGDVDNDDLAEMLSLVTATFDINARTVIERLMEKGMIELKDAYAQHPHHNTPFSGTGHNKIWSHSHPNHETVISSTWVPDYPPGHSSTTSATSPSYHTVTQSAAYPPNHFINKSQTWPPTHSTTVSGGWPATHVYVVSAGWPNTHLHSTSRNWAPGHLLTASNSTDPRSPNHHLLDYSTTWGPDHTLGTSWEQWPNGHALVFSKGWEPRPASHSIAQSRLWPANHVAAVSIGWPNPDNNWPPNHFKSITEGPSPQPAGQ